MRHKNQLLYRCTGVHGVGRACTIVSIDERSKSPAGTKSIRQHATDVVAREMNMPGRRHRRSYHRCAPWRGLPRRGRIVSRSISSRQRNSSSADAQTYCFHVRKLVEGRERGSNLLHLKEDQACRPHVAPLMILPTRLRQSPPTVRETASWNTGDHADRVGNASLGAQFPAAHRCWS